MHHHKIQTPLAKAREALSALDAADVLTVLGDILDPGLDSTVDLDDTYLDAIHPIAVAYRAAFDGFPADPDPDQAMWDEADYRYELARDERMMRDWEKSHAA